MWGVFPKTATWFFAVAMLRAGWGAVLDFDDLSGSVPDEYGGLCWVDPYFGNLWVVDPARPPQNLTPCAVFNGGDTILQVVISSQNPTEPIDFVGIDFSGSPGDSLELFGEGPGGEYHSGTITLDGVSMFPYEELWLEVISLTIDFDCLFPGSIAIDNLRFSLSSERRLGTICEEDFDSFTSDQDLLDRGWIFEHGTYPATDGGVWHLVDTVPEGGGVTGKYVISDSNAEGPLDPPRYVDEALISPEIDCTEFSGVRVEFRQNLKVYPNNNYPEVFNVHISSDPAHQNWQSNQVPFRSEEEGSCVYRQSIDISDLADGKKIKIRWRYTACFDYWWAVDEVRVIGRPKVLKVAGIQVNLLSQQVSIGWEAPDGVFAIEASNAPSFWEATELAAGITQKQWTATDPAVSEGQRYYRVRMD